MPLMAELLQAFFMGIGDLSDKPHGIFIIFLVCGLVYFSIKMYLEKRVLERNGNGHKNGNGGRYMYPHNYSHPSGNNEFITRGEYKQDCDVNREEHKDMKNCLVRIEGKVDKVISEQSGRAETISLLKEIRDTMTKK